VLRKCKFVRCGADRMHSSLRLVLARLSARSAVMSRRQSLSLGGPGPSPLYPVRCSVVSVSGHGGVPPCPGRTRLSLGGSGSCGARPLRPHASLLHKAAFCEVLGSRCAKAPLGAVHRWRALAGSQNRPYAKWPALGAGVSAVGATPVAARPPRQHLAPCGGRGTWALVRRCARCCLSVAFGQSSCVCPAHPCGPAAARLWALRGLPVRPQGAPCSTALGQGVKKQVAGAPRLQPLQIAGCCSAWCM